MKLILTAPFYRTLKQAKEKGFAKTLYEISVIAFEHFLTRLKGVPEKSIIEVNHSKMIVLPKKGGIHKELYLFRKREPLCTDYTDAFCSPQRRRRCPEHWRQHRLLCAG